MSSRGSSLAALLLPLVNCAPTLAGSALMRAGSGSIRALLKMSSSSSSSKRDDDAAALVPLLSSEMTAGAETGSGCNVAETGSGCMVAGAGAGSGSMRVDLKMSSSSSSSREMTAEAGVGSSREITAASLVTVSTMLVSVAGLTRSITGSVSSALSSGAGLSKSSSSFISSMVSEWAGGSCGEDEVTALDSVSVTESVTGEGLSRELTNISSLSSALLSSFSSSSVSEKVGGISLAVACAIVYCDLWRLLPRVWFGCITVGGGFLVH